MIKDRILRKRYKLWRERQGNYWKSPLEINEGGYLVVRYGSGSSWINEEETPVLAFPLGCQGEGEEQPRIGKGISSRQSLTVPPTYCLKPCSVENLLDSYIQKSVSTNLIP